VERGPSTTAGREERLHEALWVIVALCSIGGVAMASVRSPLVTGLLGAAFWAALAAYLATALKQVRGLAWFLPLVPLYGLTHRLFLFGWKRVTLEQAIFGTDGQRFLGLARRWEVEGRHPAWSLFTFVGHPAEELGRWLGVEGVGRFTVHLETALCGALAAWLVFRLCSLHAPRVHALLSGWFFALALAIWAHAAVIDTYIVSVFLLLVFLWEAQAWSAGERERPVILGLVTGVLLGISLENAYVPLLCVALHPLLSGARRSWRSLLGYTGTAAGVYALLAGATFLVERGAGVGADTAEQVGRYLQLGKLFSPFNFVKVLFSETIGSVVAQHNALERRYYSLAIPRIPDAPTTAYVVMCAALLAMALPFARRSELARWPLLYLLAGIFVVRHVFLMVFNPAESILFVGPSIAVLALALGWGAALVRERPRRLLWYSIVLAALDLLLFLTNATYLQRLFAFLQERQQ
jgi:hypothetical protein